MLNVECFPARLFSIRYFVVHIFAFLLNESSKLPYIPDLVTRKLSGPEKSKLEDADIAFHESEYHRLRSVLQEAHDASTLPEVPDAETRSALNDVLVRVRLSLLKVKN